MNLSSINKYKPINTTEKVYDLLEEIKSANKIQIPLEIFINEVCQNIRKYKLQCLFRDEISKIEICYVQRYKSKKGKKKKSVKQNKNNSKKEKLNAASQQIKKEIIINSNNKIHYVSPKSIVDQNLDSVVKSLSINKEEFIKILNDHNIAPNKTFSIHDYNKIKDALETSEENLFKERIKSSKAIPGANARINEKFKPTLGKPGNYNKLIYIRNKS